MNRRNFLKLFGFAPAVAVAAKLPNSTETYRNEKGVLRLVTKDEKAVEVWKRSKDGNWQKVATSK